jgi:predicted small integral membrane protein
MIFVRYCKIAFVAAIALFFTLASLGNVTDYDANWEFVKHVLSMDTIFPDSPLAWRAITDPTLQAAAYWLIIAWEAATAIVLWIGVVRLLRAVSGADFAAAKTTAVVGLSMGFVLYAVGFVVIGGEWFAMWQSPKWNGQQAAFEFLGMISAVMIILLPEQQPAHQ